MSSVDEIESAVLDEDAVDEASSKPGEELAEAEAVAGEPSRAEVQLRERLREREQLVAVLTQRLERAAEQLDRARRNGSDRGGRTISAGMPAELVQSQKKVLEDLGLAVERFEAAQAAETLGRIETQLSELRTLVVSGGGTGGTISANNGSHVGGEPHPAPVKPAAGAGASAWDALKERMLSGEDGTVEFEARQEEAEQPTDEEPSVDASSEPTAPVPVEIEEPRAMIPPDPVDFEETDPDVLLIAVIARDEYIAHLLKRLRVRESGSIVPIDWSALADAPEALCERLESLETQLQETLRRAEIEQSLERARLGRIENELELRRNRIEKELVRLGIDDVSRAQQDETDAENGPRWMRMLGLGKNDG